jgi:hypothetical protein
VDQWRPEASRRVRRATARWLRSRAERWRSAIVDAARSIISEGAWPEDMVSFFLET